MQMLTDWWSIIDDGCMVISSFWGGGSLGVDRESVYKLQQRELVPQRLWLHQLLATCGVLFDSPRF